jgi:hypothetical protein
VAEGLSVFPNATFFRTAGHFHLPIAEDVDPRHARPWAGRAFARLVSPTSGVDRLLTESQVQRSFRKLILTVGEDPNVLEKLEVLMDHLRPESPLRHRLWTEFEEVRRMQETSR